MLIDDLHDFEHEHIEGRLTEPRSEELFAERYSILKTIGAGGMGKVFAVYDTKVGRSVALKLMRVRTRDRPSLVQRFHREYRAMARTSHPGIPRVFDAGFDDTGRAYYTMELIEGVPLVNWADEAVEPRDKLALIREVARILVRVHEAGIVHRDIKPSNILIDLAHNPHLIDFGACSLSETADAETYMPPAAQINTAPGTWLGTLGYIDPAMLEGAPCSARSDIYSLAATLSWMFTQQHPSTDPLAPMPRTGIAVVDDLLRRGMARDPAARPATAAAFVAELTTAEAALDTPASTTHLQVEAAHAPMRSLSPALILALGILGGALAGSIQSHALDSTQTPQARQGRVISLPLARPADEEQGQQASAPEDLTGDAPPLATLAMPPDVPTDSTPVSAHRPSRKPSALAPRAGRQGRPALIVQRESADPQTALRAMQRLIGTCIRPAHRKTRSLQVAVEVVRGEWVLSKTPQLEAVEDSKPCITRALTLVSGKDFQDGHKTKLPLEIDSGAQSQDPR